MDTQPSILLLYSGDYSVSALREFLTDTFRNTIGRTSMQPVKACLGPT